MMKYIVMIALFIQFIIAYETKEVEKSNNKSLSNLNDIKKHKHKNKNKNKSIQNHHKKVFSNLVCVLGDWNDHKDDINELNQLLQSSQSLQLVQSIIEKYDPIFLQNQFIGSYNQKIIAHDFNLSLHVRQVYLNGFSSYEIHPLNITNPHSLSSRLTFKDSLALKLELEIEIKQLDYVKSCHENEENFYGYCYKKCSILTNNKRPVRTDSHTCGNKGWFGILYDRQTNGTNCTGFNINNDGNCPHSALKLCLTDSLPESFKLYNNTNTNNTTKNTNDTNIKKNDYCLPKKIGLTVLVDIKEPSFFVNIEAAVMLCEKTNNNNNLIIIEKICNNLWTGDIAQALFTGKYDELQLKALRRVKSLKILESKFEFKKLNDIQIKIQNGLGFLPRYIINGLLTTVTSGMKRFEFIRKFFNNIIDKHIMNCGNELIITTLKPLFGSTCYDDINRMKLNNIQF